MIKLRTLYAICLLGAACTHIWTVAMHGLLWDYGGAPIFTRVFWTSLTFLDPLAAVLLFIKPRAGVALTLAIISLDVAHNTWYLSRSAISGLWNWMYLLQVAFLLFVLLTAAQAWQLPQPEINTNL